MQILSRLRPPTVAVVDMQGMIGPAVRPLEFTRLLLRLRDDQSVRGVVLNIDSPGGTAVGAEVITPGAVRLRRDKPVAGFVGAPGAARAPAATGPPARSCDCAARSRSRASSAGSAHRAAT